VVVLFFVTLQRLLLVIIKDYEGAGFVAKLKAYEGATLEAKVSYGHGYYTATATSSSSAALSFSIIDFT
jgi:hypothetical protein